MSDYGLNKPTPKQFKRASRANLFLRMALVGPSGSGKTYLSLLIARGLVGPEGRIALIDSEHKSASKYDNLTPFDSCELENFAPSDYIEAIEIAQRDGYHALIIDSLSHAWMGKGGALEMVDVVAARSKSHNSFDAWRKVTPEHNNLVEAILTSKIHIIATMRTKTEYVVEEDPVTHKKVPRKVGTQPVQRSGLEFEFDIVGDMDDEVYTVSKTRCPTLAKKTISQPGLRLGAHLVAWLAEAPVVAPVPAPVPAQTERAPAPAQRQAPPQTQTPRKNASPAPAPSPEPATPPQRAEAATSPVPAPPASPAPSREPGEDDDRPQVSALTPAEVQGLLADIAAQQSRDALSVVEARIGGFAKELKLTPADRDVLTKRVLIARRKLGPSRKEVQGKLDEATTEADVRRYQAMCEKLCIVRAWEEALARVTAKPIGPEGDGAPLPDEDEDIPF